MKTITAAVVLLAALVGVSDIVANRPKVVFAGDSITEFWGQPGNSLMFPLHPEYVDTGIHGQTSTQILARFQRDVIARRPGVIVILAGINDLSVESGPQAFQTITRNLASMVQAGQASGARVVLASLLPINPETRVGRMYNTPEEIRAVNRWSQAYCAAHGCTYLDYYSSLVAPNGTVKAGLTKDGVHPTRAGYRIMAGLLSKALR